MKGHFSSYMLISSILVGAAIPGVLGTIVQDSGNSSSDVSAFNQNLSALRNSGQMGNALVNWANDPSVHVTVVLNASAQTGTDMSDPANPVVYLNTAFSVNHYLDGATEARSLMQGEEPGSSLVTLGHELAHATGIFGEAQDVLNYENPIREDLGIADRKTYNGQPLPANQTSWSDQATSFWESNQLPAE